MTTGHNSSGGTGEAAPAAAHPRVTVISAMYNEGNFLGQFAACMMAQDFPADDFEVLLVDGGSFDNTVELADEICRRDKRFRILYNPQRFQSQARNLGLRHARGEIIVIADIHAWYAPDFVRASVEGLEQTGAWCVGPILKTEAGAPTATARAIAIVQSHPFGVGNSQARVGKEAREVDSLAFPCLRKAVFEKVGLFHELLPRHEDTELFGRIRRAGGRLMVLPSIRATYYARGGILPLLRQAWANGYETAAARMADPASTSLRHWVPGLFVASLLGFGLGGYFLPALWWLFALMAGSYVVALAGATLHVGLKRSWRLLPWVTPVFVLHHLAYGLATVVGVVGLAWHYRKVRAYRHPVLRAEGEDAGRRAPAVLPFVTLITPVYNESKYMDVFMKSIVAQDYPADRIESLIVDGGSADDTREKVKAFAETHACFRLLDNPRRTQPAAFNIAVPQARGDVIIRVDAHAYYPSTYVRQCVETLARTGAAAVGGRWVTRRGSNTLMGSAIATVCRTRFGVGAARFRVGGKAGPTDTVPFGAYRREVFARVGLFNERLIRGEDNEFNGRLRAAGMTVWFDPEICSTYFARGGLKGFLKQQWGNGWYHLLTFRYNRHGCSLRHLVPFAFVTSLLALPVLGLFWAPAWWVLAAEMGLYLLVDLSVTVDMAFMQLQPGLLAVLPWLFFLNHVAYGAATLLGGLRFAIGGLHWRLKRLG